MLQTHQKRIHELEEKMEDMKVQVRNEIMKNENIEKVGYLLIMKVQVRHEIMKNKNIEKVGYLLTKDENTEKVGNLLTKAGSSE